MPAEPVRRDPMSFSGLNGGEMHEGGWRSRSMDDRLKRMIRRHPQRDEPLVDSVEEGGEETQG